MASRTEEVATRDRHTTPGRIRDLTIRGEHGCILVPGSVPSQPVKQPALHGALDSLSGDHLRAEILVR